MKLHLKFLLIAGIFAPIANCALVEDEDRAPAPSTKQEVDEDNVAVGGVSLHSQDGEEGHDGEHEIDENNNDGLDHDNEEENEEVVDDEDPDLDEEFDDDKTQLLTSAQALALHKKMDANGNGKVSLAEISDFATHMRRKMAVMELNDTIKSMDTNGDHKLTFQEYLGDPGKHPEEEQNEMALEFRDLDTNGDKLVDSDELTMLFQHHTNENVENALTAHAMKEKDTDTNGMLSLEEFYSYLATEPEEGEEAEPLDISDEDKEVFANLDLDNSGSLTLTELKAWESGAFQVEKAVKKIFALSDKDKDNHVTADELDKSREEVHRLEDVEPNMYLEQWATHHKEHGEL